MSESDWLEPVAGSRFCRPLFLMHLVRLKLKLHPVMPDRPTPDPSLSRASACPEQGQQAVSQAGTPPDYSFPWYGFLPGDSPFLLGLPGSVSHLPRSEGLGFRVCKQGRHHTGPAIVLTSVDVS